MSQEPGRGAEVGPPTPADHVDTQDLDLSQYQAPPPTRSAYPGPDEGGLHSDPLRQPDDDAPPGPGYGDPAAADSAEPFDTTWMIIGIVMALLLGGVTILGLITTPAVVTVAALVVIAAGVVLSWPAAAAMRRTVLLAVSGPAGVLIGYWLITLIRG